MLEGRLREGTLAGYWRPGDNGWREGFAAMKTKGGSGRDREDAYEVWDDR